MSHILLTLIDRLRLLFSSRGIGVKHGYEGVCTLWEISIILQISDQPFNLNFTSSNRNFTALICLNVLNYHNHPHYSYYMVKMP